METILRWRGTQRAQVERVEIEPDVGSYTNFEVIG